MRALQGQEEHTGRLYQDMGLLCLAYVVESVVAILWRRSTMINWRLLDFCIHHLPFAVVVGTYVSQSPPPGLVRYTSPLALMTSLNESIAAARALGAPASIDIANRFYLLVLMAVLTVAECCECGMMVINGGLPVLVRLLGALSGFAPCYHAGAVLPHCWKIVKRWTLTQLGALRPDVRKK